MDWNMKMVQVDQPKLTFDWSQECYLNWIPAELSVDSILELEFP